MPFLILYGGELVFMFLAARIACWMWRSREQVLALWRARRGGPPAGPSFTPDPSAAPAAGAQARVLPLASQGAAEAEPLRRAA